MANKKSQRCTITLELMKVEESSRQGRIEMRSRSGSRSRGHNKGKKSKERRRSVERMGKWVNE
jgi:hypothetical protein